MWSLIWGEYPHMSETYKKNLPVNSRLGKSEITKTSNDRGNITAKKALTQLTEPQL